MTKPDSLDRKRLLRAQDHLTRPPRLEGKVKNAMMNPIRKPKRKRRTEARERRYPGR